MTSIRLVREATNKSDLEIRIRRLPRLMFYEGETNTHVAMDVCFVHRVEALKLY